MEHGIMYIREWTYNTIHITKIYLTECMYGYDSLQLNLIS